MEPKAKDEIAAIQKYRSSVPLTRDEIVTLQKLRNDFLKSHNSPIPLKSRSKGFRGLDFFPILAKYQLKLKLHKYENPELVQISLSNGGKVDAIRTGYFAFELEGKKITLHVYQHTPNDPEVFLPFRDKTSGKDTYGGGRYLTLYRSADDDYVLDFNLACAPLCAFDDKKYDDCPLPPTENWVADVEIRAGEMKFKD